MLGDFGTISELELNGKKIKNESDVDRFFEAEHKINVEFRMPKTAD